MSPPPIGLALAMHGDGNTRLPQSRGNRGHRTHRRVAGGELRVDQVDDHIVGHARVHHHLPDHDADLLGLGGLFGFGQRTRVSATTSSATWSG